MQETTQQSSPVRRVVSGHALRIVIYAIVLTLITPPIHFVMTSIRERRIAQRLHALQVHCQSDRIGPRSVPRWLNWTLPYLQRMSGLTSFPKEVPDDLLRDISSLRHLDLLELRGTQLNPRGIQYLGWMTQLRSLFLDGETIEDSNLDALKSMSSLEVLHLDCYKITDTGVQKLTALKKLSYLTLNHVNLTDAGLSPLRELGHLETIILINTKVTDEGLKQLSQFKNLKFVRVDQTRTTPEGRAALRNALPKCQVVPFP